MKDSPLVPSLLAMALAACAASVADRVPAPASPDERLTRATALLDEGRYDEALLITDDLLARDPANRAARLLAARGNLALFRAGRSNARAFLLDAIRQLEKALALDEDDPESWLLLASAHLQNGQFSQGRDAALRAAALWKAHHAPPEEIARAVLAAADNELQMLADARRPELQANEDPSKDTLVLANRVLARLRYAMQGAPGPAHRRSALVYQWLGKTDEALAELERGIRAAPQDAELHQAYQKIYFDRGEQAACVAAYRRLVESSPGTPVLRWFQGIAEYALADSLRAKGSLPAAEKAYAAAARSFAAYEQAVPAHAANADHWRALCAISQGRIALEAGDLQKAERAFEQAWRATPRVLDTDERGVPVIVDSFGDYYAKGLALIGEAINRESTREALERSLRFFEGLIARHPSRLGFVYNNAALSARDLGVAVAASARDPRVSEDERRRRTERAMRLWEKAYRYYTEAVQLEPDDPRIVNDCGLMLVYYLHRDYDRARELFDRAIRLGKARLAELGEAADPATRRFLEEAVGDAYQNTAVMLRNQGRPAEEYRPLLRQAVKYYPYLRRAAAAMLRGGAGAAAAAGAVRRDGRAELLARVEKKARPLAEAGDYDSALLALDEVAKELRGYAPFHRLMGIWSLRYGEQARRRGGAATQVDGLLADAVRHLSKAVELDGEPIEPRLWLARAYHARGEHTKAAEEAERLLSHIRASGGASEDVLARTHRIVAISRAHGYVKSKQEGREDPAALRAARSSFRFLADHRRLDVEVVRARANLELWADSPRQAFDVYVAALGQLPEAVEILGGLVDLAAEQRRSREAVDVLASREDPLGTWYRGKARFYAACEHRNAGDRDAALAALRAAQADFDRAMAANPDYRASSTQWKALCLGLAGYLWLQAEESTKAEEAFLAAARLDPSRITAEVAGPGNSIRRGIVLLADRFYRKGDLATAERIYRRATTAAPEDVDLANNHGLIARDLGVRLESAGDKEAARKMFEASYASYTRAAKLQPDSIRLRNDRALLLIYHLGRDLDLARELLEGAIAEGEQRLRGLPPDEPRELAELKEAIGDCWQNLGYYLMRHTSDREGARRALEKALTYPPYRERDALRHLAELEHPEQHERGRNRTKDH